MAGTNSVLGGGGFHHVAMRAKDFDASVRFYTQALGFRAATAWGQGNQRAVMLDAGDGNFLEIFAGGAGNAPEGAFMHVALRTRDVDAAIRRVQAAGAQVTMAPKDVDIPSDPPLPVRIAFFKGPDGELVELFQQR